MTLTFAVLSTTGAKAGPQDPQIRVPDAQAASPSVASSGTSNAANLPDPIQRDTPVNPAIAPNAETVVPAAASLAELVDSVEIPADLPRDIDCLAGAIYFEAKSESLAGQLAVGRVIVARTDSGHFPASYCGVVFQHAQFSFVRGGAMPGFDRSSRIYRQAVKIALIADSGAWKSPAEGALFFHAARIGPVAGKARVARIDNHVFYR
jgi:spore germination cell wall hydrolase CwlJ-like protein